MRHSVRSIYGVIPGQFPSFLPLLSSWNRLLNNLADNWAIPAYKEYRDVPWWYGERASIGFLVASIWRVRGEAIEDYSATKKHRKNGARRNGVGRGDLMYSLNDWHTWYVAEAKYREFSMKEPDMNSVKRALQEARRDASACQNYGKAHKLGLLFIAPYWCSRLHPHARDIRVYLKELQAITKDLRATMAWTFPGSGRTVKWRDRRSGKTYYYPGAILLIKKPRR